MRIGYTVAPFIAGILAHHFGPRAVYVGQIAAALVAFTLTSTLLPFIRADQDISHKGRVQVDKLAMPPITMVSVMKSHWRPLFSVCFYVICLSICRRARELFFPLIGHDIGLSQDRIGYIISVSFGLDAVLFPVAGWLLDNIGRTRTGGLSCLGFTIAVSVLEAQTLWSFILFAVVSGIANGISSGIVQVIGADLAPPECRSEFLAIYRTLGRFADLLSPLIVGILAENSSLQVSELVVCIIGVVGACWAFGCMTETLTADTQPPAADADNLGSGKPREKGIGKYTELDEIVIGEEDQPEVDDITLGPIADENLCLEPRS